MKRVMKSIDTVLAMCNIRGRKVKNPHSLPFSFYFSSGTEIPHSIRVKPCFNPEKLKSSMVGTLKLSDSWEFTPGPDDHDISQQDVDKMRAFFKKYIVLFAAVWDEQMQDGVLGDYLEGEISFNEMLQDLEFYREYAEVLDSMSTVEELESFCRSNNLVNLYGN